MKKNSFFNCYSLSNVALSPKAIGVVLNLTIYFLGFGPWGFAQDVTLPGSTSCGGAAVSGTWTVPCDVTAITVEVYGGGGGAGGGGGGSNGGFFDTRGGGGGGGGSYTTITINVVPGSSFSYSIGSGGCGGSNGSDASDGGSGGAGGSSSFTGTDAGGISINLTANGGSGGSGGDGTEGSPGSGGAGGNSSGGSTNTTGTAGNSGSGGNGGNGGNGAGPSGGAGGVGNTAAGDLYGGGGAGGGNSQGGVGAAGAILITYTATSAMTAPTISTTPPTCTTEGASAISNYDPAMTYIFSPAGPSAGAGGAISGMVTGTTYTVVASDGNCSSAPSAPFSNSSAGVPPPAVSTSAPSCTSDGISTISNYDPALTYIFSPAGPSVGAGGVISGMTAGTGYTVEGSDGSCTSVPSASFSNAAQFPTPVVSVSSSDADSTICNGDSVIFTANPSGIANYNFLVNGISVQSGAANTYATSALTNGDNISVIPTSSDGCAGNSTNSISFTVNPIPSVSLIATDDSICPGTNVIFTATPSGNDSYEFFNGTASIQDSSSGSYSTTSLSNGNSITVVTTDLGCSSPPSNALSVYVYPSPAITLTSSDADSAICAGDTVIFTANPSGYNSYQFSVNGTPVQSSSSNTYISGALADNDVISAMATDFGCPSLQSAITFSVNPFATVNAGTDATICAGSTLALSGTIGGSATGATWTTSGNGAFDNASLQNAVYTPSSADTAAGNISMILTTNDPDGNGPCPAANDTAVLTINPEAVVNAGTDAIICADTTLALSGSFGGSAASGSWSTGGSGTFDNSSSPGATYTPSSSDISAGNVTLTLTSDDPDGSGPCPAANDSIVLTINPIPVVSVSASSNTICEDSSATFTASPATSDNYQFFINGISVQNGPGNSYSSSAITSSDTITVIATDLGCMSLLSNAVSITVNPTPSVTLSVSDNEICAGNSVTFTATAAGYDNYMFVNGVNLLQNGPSDTYTSATLSQGNSIAVIATDLGCPSPQSNIISVIVNPLPVISISQPQPFICKGDSATLTATVLSGASYIWSSGQSVNPINVAPSATTVYSVTVTDLDGCAGDTSYTLPVIPPFFVDAGSDVYVCNNAGLQISANAGFTTYQWSPAGGLSNPGIANPIANPDSATTYVVVVTDGSGCKNTDSLTVTPSYITADAGADVTINYGQENPLAGSGGTQYQWSPSSGLNCTDCQSPLASPVETTTYMLTVINAEGCSDTDSVRVEVIIPTDVFVPDAFSPNGDGENDKLFVRGPAIAELSFTVYDRWGKKMFGTNDKTVGWDGTMEGKNADAAVYVYVLYVKIVNGFEVKKKGDVTLVR